MCALVLVFVLVALPAVDVHPAGHGSANIAINGTVPRVLSLTLDFSAGTAVSLQGSQGRSSVAAMIDLAEGSTTRLGTANIVSNSRGTCALTLDSLNRGRMVGASPGNDFSFGYQIIVGKTRYDLGAGPVSCPVYGTTPRSGWKLEVSVSSLGPVGSGLPPVADVYTDILIFSLSAY